FFFHFLGPVYWGALNSDWKLCSKGKFQSPINIVPSELLFDPGLRELSISGNKVSGYIENKGNDVTFFVNQSAENSVNMSFGPLSYVYTVYQIKLHFGGSNGYGTEHKFNGKQFDAEMQIMAYNSDVYANHKMAEQGPKGLAILALFMKVKDGIVNREFNKITSNVDYIQFRDDTFTIRKFFIQRLIPDNKDYITYEGSLTQPACHETVTWILLNKPILIGQFQVFRYFAVVAVTGSCGKSSSYFHNMILRYDSQAEIIEWDDADLSTFIVEISPNDGLYKGGKFKFNFNVYEEDWPETAPIITCLTKIYHPNIDKQTDSEPDCDSTNVCAEGLEDDWEPKQSLDDCIQILLFLFYEPNILDPLSSGFPSALTNEMFAENVKKSLKGGIVHILNTESVIAFEPNYGWLQNNPNCQTEEKEMSEYKVNTDVISDETSKSVDVTMDAHSENKSDNLEMEVSHETDIPYQKTTMTCTADTTSIPLGLTNCEDASDEHCEDVEMKRIPLQRQTSKKNAVEDRLGNEEICVRCQNEVIQTQPSSIYLFTSTQVQHVQTERYVNMCNTLKRCTNICIS
ncbi:hypothetical protein FSP39_007926, partial [Pinctada imbricata]